MCVSNVKKFQIRKMRIFICSSIKGLKKAIETRFATWKISTEITELDVETLNSNPINDKDAFLVADNPYMTGVLQNPQFNFGFIQGTWAGIDSLKNGVDKTKDFKIPLCRFAHDSFSQLIAEYSVAQVINWERQFFKMNQWQTQKFWPTEHQMPRCLNQLTIGILGYGNMGKAVTSAFKAFGCTVLIIRRSKTNELNVHDMSELPMVLEKCDYLVNVLPKTDKTTDCLSHDVLKSASLKSPVLVNVGRANVISDESLLKALKEKWISGAILDVFHQEPLPQNHEFWTHPQVLITPHISALSRPEDIADCFAQNLENWQAKIPLKNVVNWKEFY